MFRFASNLFKRDSSSTDSIRRIYTTGPIRKEVNPDEERIRLSVPIDTIMSRMPDVNLFEIKTYDDEYKYYIRNHYYVYGKDINNDKHLVKYDYIQGWYDPVSGITFPYTSLYITKELILSTVTSSVPSCVPLYPSDREIPNVKLSVIINAFDHTDPIKFAYLLASFNCELMKPFPQYNNDLTGVYFRFLFMNDISNFDILCKNIIHTFPARFDPIIPNQVQLILALDNAGDEEAGKKISEIFTEFCRFYEIRDYLILRPDINSKLATMRNMAMAYATGDFIIFRDDDDMSSSLTSIIRKCKDYGTSNWGRDKIIKMLNVPFRPRSSSNGMWNLIIPQNLKRYAMNIPTMNKGEDAATHACLICAGLLESGYNGGMHICCGDEDLDILDKLIDGEYRVGFEPMNEYRPIQNSKFNPFGMLYKSESAQTINLDALDDEYASPYDKNAEIIVNDKGEIIKNISYMRFNPVCAFLMDVIKLYKSKTNSALIPKDSHYDDAMKRLHSAVNNIRTYVRRSKERTDNDVVTLMYLYIMPSDTSSIDSDYIHDMRVKTLMDYIIPDNPFYLISPNEMASKTEGIRPIDLQFMDYEYTDILDTDNKFIHPDEQRFLTITDGRGRTRQEAQWVSQRIDGKRRSTPLRKTKEEVTEHNLAMKKDFMSKLHGGNYKDIILILAYILLFIIILIIVCAICNYIRGSKMNYMINNRFLI